MHYKLRPWRRVCPGEQPPLELFGVRFQILPMWPFGYGMNAWNWIPIRETIMVHEKKQSFGGWNFGWPAGTVGILSRKANDILFAGCLPFLVSGKLSWPLRHISVDLSWMFWWVASGQTNGMEFLSIMMRPRYWTHDCLDLVWFDFISCFMFMETMHGRGELQCNNLDFVFWRFYLVLCIHSKYFEGGYHVTRGRRLERPHQVPILLSPFGSWDAGTQPMDMFFWTSFKVYITAFVPET